MQTEKKNFFIRWKTPLTVLISVLLTLAAVAGVGAYLYHDYMSKNFAIISNVYKLKL